MAPKVQDNALLMLPVQVVESKDSGNILLEFKGEATGQARRFTADQADLEIHTIPASVVVHAVDLAKRAQAEIDRLTAYAAQVDAENGRLREERGAVGTQPVIIEPPPPEKPPRAKGASR